MDVFFKDHIFANCNESGEQSSSSVQLLTPHGLSFKAVIFLLRGD
jgi:hypothetical protein